VAARWVQNLAKGVKIKAGCFGSGQRLPQRASNSQDPAAAENNTPGHAFADDLAKRRRAVHLSECSLHCSA